MNAANPAVAHIERFQAVGERKRVFGEFRDVALYASKVVVTVVLMWKSVDDFVAIVHSLDVVIVASF